MNAWPAARPATGPNARSPPRASANRNRPTVKATDLGATIKVECQTVQTLPTPEGIR